MIVVRHGIHGRSHSIVGHISLAKEPAIAVAAAAVIVAVIGCAAMRIGGTGRS
jgi:hypothetical protein